MVDYSRHAGALMVLLAALAVSGTDETGHDLIGWLGDTYTTAHHKHGAEVLSWDPRIVLFHGFLTPEECDELMADAQPRLTRSGVANAETGAGGLSDIRTSHGMFYARGETELIRRIEKRLAAWTLLPPDNGEGIQVLRYQKAQKYDPHHDYFSFEGRDDNGGNRMATVLMYLAAPEEGGETVFPKVPIPATQTRAEYSECAMKGMAVKPQKGDAILFFSIRPDGRFDAKSLHGSCPVIKGTKWSATKWIHVGHYAIGGEAAVKVERVVYTPPPPPAVPGCTDQHKLCSHWAESGECESNSGYMVGSRGKPGACILSCNRCDLGPN